MPGILTHYPELIPGGSWAGFLARLRGWFGAREKSFDAPLHQPGAYGVPEDPRANEATGKALVAQVLPFPIRGEALLVRLADLLRSRFGGGEYAGNPPPFEITRTPRSRLIIDRAAYVEILDECGPIFLVAIEAAPDTTVSVETADLDVVVGFIMHYVGDKLDDPVRFEVVS